MSTDSIWGPIQTSITIAEGIHCVTTASHGGYILSEARLDAMPTAFPRHDHRSYEEDLACCFVALAFPEYFDTRMQHEAHQTCKDWFPEVWEAWTGTTLSLDESSTKRTEAWYHDQAQDWLMITTWGEWHPDVPKGFVAVCARQGGRQKHTDVPDQYFLVAADEYRASRLQFMVDPSRHRRIESIT